MLQDKGNVLAYAARYATLGIGCIIHTPLIVGRVGALAAFDPIRKQGDCFKTNCSKEQKDCAILVRLPPYESPPTGADGLLGSVVR